MSDKLKMVDVPAEFADLLFDFIESLVCFLVTTLVGVVEDLMCELLDALCVISQCHGISLEWPARHCENDK